MWSVVGCDALQPRHPSRMRPRRASPSRFWADEEKSGAFGTGSWTDTPLSISRLLRKWPGRDHLEVPHENEVDAPQSESQIFSTSLPVQA